MIDTFLMPCSKYFINVFLKTMRQLKPPNRSVIDDGICPDELFYLFCWIVALNDGGAFYFEVFVLTKYYATTRGVS